MNQKLEMLENSVIPIYKGRAIDGKMEHVQLVDARELHRVLQVGRDFSNWIKDRIEKYEFIEGVDFSPNLAKTSNFNERGGRPSNEYVLTLDTAKEIAMVENNEIGRTIRRYLIEIEKRYHNLAIERAKGKTERRVLTDIIKELVPESPHKRWIYKHYTDLVYKVVTGYTAKEIREQNGLDFKANIRDYLSEEQTLKIQHYEKIIQGLLSLGLDYEQIKTLLTQPFAITANVKQLGVN